MLELIKSIFPATHVHPHKPIHAFSQPFDPMTSELQADEHGCGPVVECALVLDFERDGRRKLVVQ